MGVPGFLLRKLYKRGSLIEHSDGTFAFTMQNPLASTTLISPPQITVNGLHHAPHEVDAGHIELSDISPTHPFVFQRGMELQLRMTGRLMRSNRIHIRVHTKEFDDVDFLVEDRLPTGDEEE